MTCLEDCNSSTSNCTDVACSSKLDINGNPYQCLSEEEAQNWHKKCLPDSHQFCRYTGRYYKMLCTYYLVLTDMITFHLNYLLLNQTNKYFSYLKGEYDECKWTGWLDQDNPSGYGDYEPVPEGCKVQKYKVQEVSGGTIYDDVSAMSQCLIDSPYVACINSHQGSDCHKIGPINPRDHP